MKRIAIVALMLVLLISASFGQIMLGVTGALHTDTSLSASEINQRFSNGEGIFYGPYAEIVFHKLGIGFAGNFSFYNTTDPTTLDGTNIIPVGTSLTDYDLTLYLSYHLFGGRAFLDPFGEFGGGILATGFTNQSDQDTYDPYTDPYFLASYYWYAALGLGINLGPIGVFGKFSYNYPIHKAFETEWKTGGSTPMWPYGYDSILFPDGYLPKFRITFGAKLIL